MLPTPGGFYFLGEVAAVTTALLWAVATVLYGRIGRSVSPMALNLMKNVIAAAMLWMTLLPTEGIFFGLDRRAFVLLLLSGAIGIGVGDSAFFKALGWIGPRKALLLMTLSPPMTALLALVFLHEALTLRAWLGVVITVCGVGWVIADRAAPPQFGQGSEFGGAVFAALAALCQAAGAVLSHAAFLHLNLSPARTALTRLAGGILILLVLSSVMRRAMHVQWRNSSRIWGLLLITVFLGTYLALWLQQVSLKYAAAGIAQTLFATSPLFVLPIALKMGERITFRAVSGVVVALVGVAMLF
jgi:drug/metabolite transporter (DMT)-like permease